MTFEEAWEIGNWIFEDDDDNEKMKAFVDDRTVIIKLTEDECKECRESARQKAKEKGGYYGDFAQSNFNTGNKGELAVLNYLYKVKPFSHYDYHKNQILKVRPYGDGGVDIELGKRRIDVKTTRTEYGPLIVPSHRERANLYIHAHLKYDGFNRQRGRTHFSEQDRVFIYGFLTAKEFYESYEEDGKSYLKRVSHHYPRGSKKLGPPNNYQASCWVLRPMDQIKEVMG